MVEIFVCLDGFFVTILIKVYLYNFDSLNYRRLKIGVILLTKTFWTASKSNSRSLESVESTIEHNE